MCGLSGIISKQNVNDLSIKDKLLQMTELISHRGPDQVGYLNFENVYLSHVRLSVMDPRNLGRQPMSNDDRFAIIFNGEIYNFLEIKKTLIEKGYKFYTNTDTEVGLNAYKEWGEKCFEIFNGDWVISILDKLKKRLIIAKDQIGSLPIYFYNDSNYFAFSSEIKGLKPISELEYDENFLGLSGLTISNFHGTKFKNISQIKPGTYLNIDLESKKIDTLRWFHPLNNLVSVHPSYKQNQEEIFQRLYDATKLRLNADIKVGTSLSGGLDSSIIFSIMNLIASNESIKKEVELNPTIVNYDGNLTFNEATQFSDLHERKYNLFYSKMPYEINHLTTLLSQLELTEEYNKQFDLYKEQKKLGIHVSVDGHGADEFSGMISDLPNLSLKYYNNLVDMNTINNNYKNKNNIEIIDKFFDKISHKNKKANFQLRNLIDISNIFIEYIKSDQKIITEQEFLIQEYFDDLQDFPLDFQYTFFKTHAGFLQHFTHKWNKAGMASSVEVRSPFLDKNVYLYLLSIPTEKKINNGKIKSLLKDSFSDHLPKYILNQNFKQGLPREKPISNEVLKRLINEIIFEKKFSDDCWDVKLVKKDFNEGKNLKRIWELCKHYIMKEGFSLRMNNLSQNTNYLTDVPGLHKMPNL